MVHRQFTRTDPVAAVALDNDGLGLIDEDAVGRLGGLETGAACGAFHVLELLDAAGAEDVAAGDELGRLHPRLEADVAHEVVAVVAGEGEVGH